MTYPPGWHSDPTSRNEQRWWDGTQWTEHVVNNGTTGIDMMQGQRTHTPAPAAGLNYQSPQMPPVTRTDSAPESEPLGATVPLRTRRMTKPSWKERRAAKLTERARQSLETESSELLATRDELAAKVASLRSELAELESLSDIAQQRSRLQQEVQTLNEQCIDIRATADLQDIGFFDFEHPAADSAALATELETTRTQIKDMIRNKTAATAAVGFTFNDSIAKGRKFVADLTRLSLRAYNAEAENAVKTTKAGNLKTAQARLSRAAEQIKKNGTMIDLAISPQFHHLRLREIELANRHMVAVQRERELERERRADLREQQKAEQELRREHDRLKKERAHYEATLTKLQQNGDTDGVARILEKITDVDRALVDVDYRTANMRAGYVYVISNLGAFGPDVVKIGMTRRLDPMDRVRELGDASVPFRFDVHALFFADDAIGIEAMLHREFAHSRLNQVNLRREFFRVTPDDVLNTLRSHAVELVEFRIEADAEEYRQSQTAV